MSESRLMKNASHKVEAGNCCLNRLAVLDGLPTPGGAIMPCERTELQATMLNELAPALRAMGVSIARKRVRGTKVVELSCHDDGN